MFNEVTSSFRLYGDTSLRRRIVAVYLFLAALNAAAWTLACCLFYANPAALSLCFLAYGFGLRHAVDADHIAAIDNVTRKLMREKQRPVAVGLFFSLGHSTIVILLSLLVAEGTGYVKNHFPQLQSAGGIIGAAVSAAFLVLIAIVNFIIFLEVFKDFRAARRGNRRTEEGADSLLSGEGIVARTLRSLFRFVGKSWHMYFVGFLFGLGFDTATEIALLGIAATESARQAPIWSIMVFPLLFTSGMTLLDTTDGVVMLGAYGWAFVKPMRKLFYNMTITLLSFLVALLIGTLEAVSVIASKFELTTGVWAVAKTASDNWAVVGYCLIGLMIAGWLASMAIYRVSGLAKLDE